MVKLVTSFSSQGSIWQNLYQTLRYFNNCSGSFSGHFECLISLSLLKKKKLYFTRYGFVMSNASKQVLFQGCNGQVLRHEIPSFYLLNPQLQVNTHFIINFLTLIIKQNREHNSRDSFFTIIKPSNVIPNWTAVHEASFDIRQRLFVAVLGHFTNIFVTLSVRALFFIQKLYRLASVKQKL